MTAKEFLRQYHDCEQQIESRKNQISKLRAQAESVTQTLSERVQSSGSGDSAAKIIDTYLDMERGLESEVIRLREVQQQIKAAISSLSDSRQRNVLERYYLDGMTFEETAENLDYSYQWVCTLHGRALEKIKELILVDNPSMI